MSPDLFKRFSSIKNVSPTRIREIISSHKKGSFRDVWSALDPLVVKSFLSSTLRFNKKKYTAFSRDVEQLLDKYPASQISKLDASCINEDGRINIDELNRILFDE